MSFAADLFSVCHFVALSAFVGGMSVAMLVAVISRLRIRRPLLVWRTGPLTCVPIGPLIFLLVVAAGFSYAWMVGSPPSPSVLIGYPAGGVFWFIATWLVRSVVVTEYGLVPDISRVHRTVAWGQIVDYVSTTREGQPHFVFFYRGNEGDHHRLDLSVPSDRLSTFQSIVASKVDARLSVSPSRTLDEESIDWPDDLDRP